jgi:hypothetical protein
MLSIAPIDPSALAQAVVYLTGVLLGHALLTPTEDLQRAWETVRSALRRRKE